MDQPHSPSALPPTARPLIDSFGRQISYVRISVTDRCDYRCVYCMGEDMQFLPKKEVLSYAEIDAIAAAFIARGTTRIRLTGGEPLVRRDILTLVEALGRRIGHGLKELTLTTNGSQLSRLAPGLFAAGVRRINVSLDSLDAERFAAITRRGRLTDVLEGMEAARDAGLQVKINMVPLRGINDDEIEAMLAFAHARGMDLTLIEGMPLGDVALDRAEAHLPLRAVRDALATRYHLTPIPTMTGGPARYVRVEETGGRLGFITPLTHNFCESCNRVRLTASGQLYLCLGQEDSVNLRDAWRDGGADALDRALDHAMRIKPKGHDFVLGRAHAAPAVERHMSVTGG
jgi:cyclic pyranopterin phosphate synthase